MNISLTLQDLPEEAVKEDLIESSQSEEILQKSCPLEYSALKEEEVRHRDFSAETYRTDLDHFLGTDFSFHLAFCV